MNRGTAISIARNAWPYAAAAHELDPGEIKRQYGGSVEVYSSGYDRLEADDVFVLDEGFRSVVAFSGSRNTLQWLANFRASKSDHGVHEGMSYFLDRVQDSIVERLARLNHSRILFTGPSRGGAMAHLLADRLSKTTDTFMTCVTFGAPRFAERRYWKGERSKNLSVLRVVNGADIVPHLPSSFRGWRHDEDYRLDIGYEPSSREKMMLLWRAFRTRSGKGNLPWFEHHKVEAYRDALEEL